MAKKILKENLESVYKYLYGASKVSTVKDFAEEIGVSKTNLSSELNGDTRCLTSGLADKITTRFNFINRP